MSAISRQRARSCISRRRSEVGPGSVIMTAARTQRKPWAWGWRVVYCVIVEKKSQRAVTEEFAADGKHISTKYVRSCMADYNKYLNPNHRTEAGSQFREASLAADQRKYRSSTRIMVGRLHVLASTAARRLCSTRAW